ncbi:unnamed protein product, partial [Porites lobata]
MACTVNQKNIGHSYTNQRILPFVTQYQPSVPNLKQILMKNWHLIEQQPLLSEIYKKPPLVSYKRGRHSFFNKGRPVQAVPLEEALSRMKAWLKTKSPCLLIAHNCKCFDAKHLMKAFESTGLYKEFSAIVPGFSDTLTAFRGLLPARKSHSQENLVQDLLLCSYGAHNAIADAQSLFKLVSKFLNSKLVGKHSF